jgi:hypothetical protein
MRAADREFSIVEYFETEVVCLSNPYPGLRPIGAKVKKKILLVCPSFAANPESVMFGHLRRPASMSASAVGINPNA